MKYDHAVDELGFFLRPEGLPEALPPLGLGA
jgi:hypothetical protein